MTYAGDITPEEAWKLLTDNPEAVLVDCRTDAEWRFVGVADLSDLDREVVYVEWNTSDGKHNDNFVEDLLEKIGVVGSAKDRPVVFLCRSGNRSIGAAEAATEAGIAPSYNILDGFEGNLDEHKHRGVTGWKAVGLPWRQS
ncbi:Rhodanese-related sulfurtransferase [Mycolicibacterium rhodesiae NBB3]|jgi:rhodanese-related sulfurtransferase|uniref:Rhodanese-related sulfurtransferase n=1 Tax=Mycolicibacterium rhodesiae (strain NBB3) TaxID=710685 RepID=G8RX62_MYCRN|nr:rhodanese-like domain-containing protein [Mycolicibacterium rhodesiae]AEV71919.1 Rhodanese-related sulfurtransferase [Mycolicibacterium rhodesiae NBB3]